MEPARLLTSGELARRLGVSTSTVSDWARSGLITPELRTAGGHYRWVEADVRAQLADRWANPEVDPDSTPG
jgi:excisionase family DNA binding protein